MCMHVLTFLFVLKGPLDLDFPIKAFDNNMVVNKYCIPTELVIFDTLADQISKGPFCCYWRYWGRQQELICLLLI